MLEAVEYQQLSNSKAKTWNRCHKQFEFKYKLNLKPKRRAVQLTRGSWMHELLQWHYDGMPWRERLIELKREFIKLPQEDREEMGDLPKEVLRLMLSYLTRWREQDKLYHTVDTELDEVLTLPNGLRFRIIIDKIVEDRSGGLWIVDYKTGKDFLPPDFLLLDAQLARYFWGAEKLGYSPLRGIIYDEISTRPPTLPKVLPSNGRLERRQNIRCDVYTYYRHVRRLGHDPTDNYYRPFIRKLMARRGEWWKRTPMPKDKPLTRRLMKELVHVSREIKMAEEHDAFPRSPMKSCRWDCDFLDPCSISLMGGNIRPVLDLRYEERKPRDEAKGV